ncbi:hypothetical protein LXT12_26610 [Pelomonas sp. P7]|uniref:Uncharacterized protein n=1 Tax=Pelomonas caseinilytica TaxID=2906763 RepID=A0ABS8XMG6_9BURK|nr:hypothetical protein [Pelomonas sp. P7]MCE4540802.1 hypothetical protein [Pelomonas sp. P7]
MIRMEGEGLRSEMAGELPVLWGLIKRKKTLAIAGFYATRYVEAEDADTAINLVRSSIKDDLAEALVNARGSMDGLVLKVDGIETVDPRDVDANAKGFTFFKES